jgi:ATP-dependent DNA helicase 2 subunit 2
MIDATTTGKTGNKLKFDRKINIISDGYGFLDTSDVDAIAEKLKEDAVEVNILCAVPEDCSAVF